MLKKNYYDIYSYNIDFENSLNSTLNKLKKIKLTHISLKIQLYTV